MCEFRKLLSHLNDRMALPVCIFTVLNMSYTFSAIIYFIKIYNRYTCMKVIVMGLVNIVLWLILGLYPFFQVSSPLFSFQRPDHTLHLFDMNFRPPHWRMPVNHSSRAVIRFAFDPLSITTQRQRNWTRCFCIRHHCEWVPNYIECRYMGAMYFLWYYALSWRLSPLECAWIFHWASFRFRAIK